MAKHETNLFKEGLHVGLGLALRTKEMIEEFGKKVSKQYEMTEEEGKHFVDDLMKESEETRTRLDEVIEKRIDKYVRDLNLAKKEDLDKVNIKLAEISKKLDGK